MMHELPERRLLSRREAARALGVSVDTLARLLSERELKAVRIGRSVLVPESELTTLIERRLDGEAQGPERHERERRN